jgi:hypothetical protein
MNKTERIIKDIECLMSKILLNDIPGRAELPKNHTLSNTAYWRGAHLCVISSNEDIPRSDGFYPADNYISTDKPYETSWIMCELRDIYMNNDFYDFDLKYELFDVFSSNFKRYDKKKSLYKDSILKAIQDMIYSDDSSFLPNKNIEEHKYNILTTDIHLGAES